MKKISLDINIEDIKKFRPGWSDEDVETFLKYNLNLIDIEFTEFKNDLLERILKGA